MRPIWTIATITGICAIGSTLVSVALASVIFADTGSASRSALVFLIQFLPVAVLFKLIWRLSERGLPRSLIGAACVVSCLLSVVLGIVFALEQSILLYGLLVVRGFLECVIKQGRTVAIKALSENLDVGAHSTSVTLFEFAGQAIGAVFAIYALRHLTSLEICMLDAALFLVGGAMALALPAFNLTAPGPSAPNTLSGTLRQLPDHPSLLFYLTILIGVVVTLQAANQTLRTWLPMHWLGMTSQFVGVTETISLIGIVFGIVVARISLKRDQLRPAVASAFAAVAALLLVMLFVTRGQWVVLFAYLVYMILFEAAFAYSMSAMLISCPPELTKSVVALAYAVSYGGVAISGFALAVASDLLGFDRVAVFASVPLVVLAAVMLRSHTRVNQGMALSERTR
jgi:hypothetical protein